MSRLVDGDGTPLVRTRDGDLVPDPDPAPPVLPPLAADAWCPDHVGTRAAACAGCRADVLAGDRPPWAVGQRLEDVTSR